MLNSKNKLYLLSILATIVTSFIPGIGIRIDGTYRYFGFPAQWFGYFGGGQFSFEILGLLFNLVVFYFLFSLLNKVLKKIRTKNIDGNDEEK